jgi:hypothetical protein
MVLSGLLVPVSPFSPLDVRRRPPLTFPLERLMEIVGGDTGADVDLQIEALRPAGALRREH